MIEAEMQGAENDFVEYQLDIEGGEIVACRYFGEGKQAEPLDGLKVYVPTGQPIDHRSFRWIERLERRLKLSFSRLP